jgi:transcriptional regulator with XRE-family HTH domain
MRFVQLIIHIAGAKFSRYLAVATQCGGCFHKLGPVFVKTVNMSRALIGRTVRRLRGERQLSQQSLAGRLGISASYLNLIEHDQRAVTASLLIKLGETLRVDLATLSGTQERQLEVGLREAFADPLLGAEAVPDEEAAALAGSAPNAARAVLALYRAWRVAREDSGGIALPSGPSSCRTTKPAISSTTAATISRHWRRRPRRWHRNWRQPRPR